MDPPSLSITRPCTVYVPLLANVKPADPVVWASAYPFSSLLVRAKLYRKDAASVGDGSVAPVRLTVAGLPAATGPLLPMEAVGLALVTVRLATAVADSPPASVTRSVTVLPPLSVMPRAVSFAHVSVGVLPAASVKSLSPFTSQAYTSPARSPGVSVADPLRVRLPPSGMEYGPPAVAPVGAVLATVTPSR